MLLPNEQSKKLSSDIISLSRTLLNQLYTGTPADMLPWLHQDIIWTDATACRCFYGYYQVAGFLTQSAKIKAHEVRHLQYHIRSLENSTYIITGKYKAIQKEADRFGDCMTYQVSLVWTSIRDSPRLAHLHISPISRQALTCFLVFHGKKAETYRLLPEEILYIEAENVNCTIHTTSDRLSVCQPISKMEQQLPCQFLRVHRSFIINRHYVSRIYRYAIELSNHAVIPIPEKKYMSVICEIERQDF